MKPKPQYVFIDKKHRRHSAPENLETWSPPRQSRPSPLEREFWCRASVSDFSVLLEKESESNSSLELDTSTLSRDLSPNPTVKSSPKDSYQNLSVIDFEARNTEDSLWNSLNSWFVWKNILLSQIVAGCITVMVVFNNEIRKNSHNLIINGQNLPHYFLLSIMWTTKLAFRNDGRDIIQVIRYSGLRYLFLSILHVEANYLLLSSFHHNTYLGNQTVDAVAASLTIIIAYVCLEVPFNFIHFCGFGLTFFGCIGFCLANIIHQCHNHEDVLLGDVLRVASGLFLAFNSTAQEIIIKSIDFVEYMGMVGLFGSFVCSFQVMVLERNKVIPKSPSYWYTILYYSITQFFFNSVTPKILRDMGATGLHLALTTSVFYFYIFGVLCEHDKLELLYFISYVSTLLGSSIFTIKRTSLGTHYFFPIKVVLAKEK